MIRIMFAPWLQRFLIYVLGVSVATLARGGSCGEPDPGTHRAQPEADRDLSLREMQELFRLSNILIDQELYAEDRRNAANQLGEVLAHKYCIPALLAVLRDPTDNADIRQKCVLALSWIADRRVVDYLIEALRDPDLNVAQQSRAQLQKLTGHFIPQDKFDLDPLSESRNRFYRSWRLWWADHRGDVQIRWGRARVL